MNGPITPYAPPRRGWALSAPLLYVALFWGVATVMSCWDLIAELASDADRHSRRNAVQLAFSTLMLILIPVVMVLQLMMATVYRPRHLVMGFLLTCWPAGILILSLIDGPLYWIPKTFFHAWMYFGLFVHFRYLRELMKCFNSRDNRSNAKAERAESADARSR
ncbi:MAG: hypothetical protein HYV27_06990 [Candidatus Hydrogenedentes bacterium]|nr:hypothetical protein [Candidatus Hydrogenedentota bacterium]